MKRSFLPRKLTLWSAVAVLCAGCATSSNVHLTRDHLGTELTARGLSVLRDESASVEVTLPPGVSVVDGIDETEAIAIALWNNAIFQENLSRLGLARGDVAQAGMLANPTLSLLFPVGPKQLEFTTAFSLDGLWLRRRRMDIAGIEAERIAQGLIQSGLDLARDVRLALSDCQLALDRTHVADQSLKIRDEIARIVENRQQLGEATALETIAAHAERARAHDDADRIRRDLLNSRERVSLLLGWRLPFEATLVSNPRRPALNSTRFDALDAKALSSRPDLRASELALESAGRKAGLADREAYTLSGMIDANAQGKDGFEIGPGISLPIPLLNQNQPNRLRVKAELARAAWNYVGTRQRILFDLHDARSRVMQANETLSAYERNVIPPFEDVERVSRQTFELGETSPLVMQENARQLLLVRLRHAELCGELRHAWADLERAVGARLE